MRIILSMLLMSVSLFFLAYAAAYASTGGVPSSFTTVLGIHPTYTGLSAWVGDTNSTPTVVSYGGINAWQTDLSAQNYYIYFRVNPAELQNLSHDVSVTVRYWNGGKGKFTIQYNSTSRPYRFGQGAWRPFSQGYVVHLTNLPEWRSYTFYLNNAAFNNSLNGASFRLSVLLEPAGQVSQSDVAISQVVVMNGYHPAPKLLFVETQLGNVFVSGKTPEFHFITQGDSVRYQVVNYWHQQVATGTVLVKEHQCNITILGLKYGYFKLLAMAKQGNQVLATVPITFAVLPVPSAATDSQYYFGVNTHFAKGVDPAYIPLLVDAGIHYNRDELYWEKIERTVGQYDFRAPYNVYMTDLKQDNVSPLIIIGYVNPLYQHGQVPTSKTAINAFVQYALATLKQYPQIHAVEVWNEPNNPYYFGGAISPQKYLTLLKAVYTAIKAAYPNIKVVGGAVAGYDTTWMQKLFQLGGLQYMDALSIHPYRYPLPPEGLGSEMTALEHMIQSYNSGHVKPIWISEIGWPTQIGNSGVSQSTQAAYLVRSAVIALSAGVHGFFWYDFMNDGLDPNYNEDNFGIIHNAEDMNGAYTPKPAYNAYATLIRELSNSKYIGTIGHFQEIRGYQFQRPGTSTDVNGRSRMLTVLWSTGNPVNVELTALHPVIVTGLMGNAIQLYPYQGHVYLTLTGNPVYVSGKIEHVSKGGPFGMISPGTGLMDATEPVTISVTSQESLSATFVMESKIYEVSNSNVKPTSSGMYLASETVTVPTSPLLGTQTIWATIMVRGQPIGRIAVQVVLKPQTPSLVVVPSISSVSPAKLALDVQVIDNSMSSPLLIQSIHWRVETQSGTLATSATVSPNTTQTLSIPLMPVQFNTIYPVQISVFYNNDQEVTFSGHVTFTPVAHQSLERMWTWNQVSTQPSISLPDQGQWVSLISSQPYEGASDLSGNVWLNWDSQNLYITVRLKERTFYQPYTGGNIWEGDSIQFAVSPILPSRPSSSKAISYQYGMALTPKGPQVYRWVAPPGVNPGPVTNASIRITRNDKSGYTTYYLAMPWSDLTPVSPQHMMFGLSLLVNVNDGSGRKGYMQWGGGIGSGIVGPSQFNFAQLMP